MSECVYQHSVGAMSIAEFYIDNGIDPGDPHSFDAFMQGLEEGHSDGGWAYAARHGMFRDSDDDDDDLIDDGGAGDAATRNPRRPAGGRVLPRGAASGRRSASKQTSPDKQHWTCHSCRRKLAACGFISEELLKSNGAPMTCKICARSGLASRSGTTQDGCETSAVKAPRTHAECGTCGRMLAAIAFDARLNDIDDGKLTCKICVRNCVARLPAAPPPTESSPLDAPVSGRAAGKADNGPSRKPGIFCSACSNMFGADRFSARQRKKGEQERRCKACISRDPSTAAAHARTSLL